MKQVKYLSPRERHRRKPSKAYKNNAHLRNVSAEPDVIEEITGSLERAAQEIKIPDDPNISLLSWRHIFRWSLWPLGMISIAFQWIGVLYGGGWLLGAFVPLLCLAVMYWVFGNDSFLVIAEERSSFHPYWMTNTAMLGAVLITAVYSAIYLDGKRQELGQGLIMLSCALGLISFAKSKLSPAFVSLLTLALANYCLLALGGLSGVVVPANVVGTFAIMAAAGVFALVLANAVNEAACRHPASLYRSGCFSLKSYPAEAA